MIQRYFLPLQGIGLNEPMAFDAMRLNLQTVSPPAIGLGKHLFA